MLELQLKPEELRNEVLMSRDENKQKAAKGGQVKISEKLWGWATELQLQPKELRN